MNFTNFPFKLIAAGALAIAATPVAFGQITPANNAGSYYLESVSSPSLTFTAADEATCLSGISISVQPSESGDGNLTVYLSSNSSLASLGDGYPLVLDLYNPTANITYCLVLSDLDAGFGWALTARQCPNMPSTSTSDQTDSSPTDDSDSTVEDFDTTLVSVPVNVAPVPEPSTWLATLPCVALLAASLRKTLRRKHFTKGNKENEEE